MTDNSYSFAAAWQNYRAQAAPRTRAAEIEHWKATAAYYDRANSLAKDAPQLVDRLLNLLNEVKAVNVLEIGAGTGEFSLPIVKAGYHLTALDQSPDMLEVLTNKLQTANLREFQTVAALWEDYEPQPARAVEVVLSVNSFYRVPDIKVALAKVNRLATKRAIFIRSVGGQPAPSPLFYREFGAQRLKPVLPDHLYILGALYELDINANLNVYEVTRHRNFADFAAIERMAANWFVTPPTPGEQRRLAEILHEMSMPGADQSWIFSHNHAVAFLDWQLSGLQTPPTSCSL